MQLTPGKRVLLEFNSEWHPACIVEASEDGLTCTARYEDGRDEEVGIDVPSRIRPRVQIADLEVGQPVTGRVANVVEYGFFLDIGAERNGLVHLSKMSEEHITDDVIHLYIKQGEEVNAWVLPGLDEGKLAFTMVRRKDGTKAQQLEDIWDFENIHFSKWVDGTVNGFAEKGLWVYVRHPISGAVVEGRVPAHELPIPDVSQEDPAGQPLPLPLPEGQEAGAPAPSPPLRSRFKIGDPVKVRVMGVDTAVGRMYLSMRELRGRDKGQLDP